MSQQSPGALGRRRPASPIAFDDPSLAALGGGFISISPDRLYLTVSEFESVVWVANLRY
jgi:hypothetical protein